MTGIVGEWTPIRSQAKVQSECLVELMQQRKVQVPYEGSDTVDIDRADLLGLLRHDDEAHALAVSGVAERRARPENVA